MKLELQWVCPGETDAAKKSSTVRLMLRAEKEGEKHPGSSPHPSQISCLSFPLVDPGRTQLGQEPGRCRAELRKGQAPTTKKQAQTPWEARGFFLGASDDPLCFPGGLSDHMQEPPSLLPTQPHKALYRILGLSATGILSKASVPLCLGLEPLVPGL